MHHPPTPLFHKKRLKGINGTYQKKPKAFAKAKHVSTVTDSMRVLFFLATFLFFFGVLIELRKAVTSKNVLGILTVQGAVFIKSPWNHELS